MGHHERVFVGGHHDRERYIAKVEEMMLPPLVSAEKVAEICDINRRRIYELIENGDFVAVRIGVRGVRIFRESLLDWLRRGGTHQS